jgi:long-chain acyl-CoA synthetase
MNLETLEAPRPRSLEYWAVERPDAIAIVEGERELSWGAWNAASNRVAEALAARGVGAGDIIAVRTQIRTEWAIISGALAKLGGAILGLNWRLTPAEVAYVASNSGARGLICDDADPVPLLGALKGLSIKLAVSIDAEAPGFTNWSDLLLAPEVPRLSAQEAGLVIYTSGTTGLPKGVALSRPTREHAQRTLEYAASMEEKFPRRPDDVVLCSMPFSHGAGPGLIRGSVTAGNRMVFMRRFDPELTLKLIQEHRITYWMSVPTMLKRLAALPEQVFRAYDVSSIRALQTGAAPVPYSLKLWVIEHFGDDVLYEGYGATEVGMISLLTPEMQRRKPGSSGLPHRHVDISVRDEAGAALPVSAVGELWIRTPITIANYLNAPALDEGTLDRDGFFRTGDVGYLDEDGYVFITDRAKDMIISGGVNIYPAEIEAALIRHAAVQDVAVIGIPDEEFGEQVKAFVEVKPGHRLTADELLDFARETLASYKRPKSVDIVEELPRNTMGKVLKKDLRAPYWEGRERRV